MGFSNSNSSSSVDAIKGRAGERVMLSSHPPGSDSLPCPRCNSQDTKFCYYNNYSTAQPRHFCKNCKRYWTAGGSLRNIPVGGGLRKNKKSKLSKHVKEILSKYPHEQLVSSGNLSNVLMGSPSSSSDVVVDEGDVNGKLQLPWYNDAPSVETLLGAPFAMPQFNHMNVSDLARIHGYSWPLENHQMPNNNTGCMFRQPDLFKGPNQAQSDSSELSEGASEFSQVSHSVPLNIQPSFPVLAHVRYPSRTNEHPAKNVANTALRELEQFNGQGNLQCFMQKQDGKPRDNLSTDDEDGELGNVINVRYPYDWEQVSEVLFGGTPDFFQMPSF